jgi:hypothetical protein
MTEALTLVKHGKRAVCSDVLFVRLSVIGQGTL